jgi:hypothetical protein
VLWFVAFGIAGTAMLVRSGPRPTGLILLVAAVLVPALGALSRRFLRCVYLGMAYVAFPIGFVISHVLLALIYYALLTPLGLLMRGVGYDPLHRRCDPEKETYWIPRQQPADKERYFRQF